MVSPRTALLLELLRGPGFGLDLAARLSKFTRGRVSIPQATLYPALRALEEEGLVRVTEQEQPHNKGGRPRRICALTARGRRTAKRERDVLLDLVPTSLDLEPNS